MTGPAERPDPGALLRNAAVEYARHSRELGVAPDEAVDAVRAALASLDTPSQ